MSADKKIIVVWGTRNSGKTTVIKKVYELITEEYSNIEEVDYYGNTETDICKIVTVRGVKIGIHSKGDYKEHVKCGLNKFSKCDLLKCDLIICATLSRGGTVDVVTDFENKNKDYCVVWKRLIRVNNKDKSKICEAKMETASMILDEVQEFIDSRNR